MVTYYNHPLVRENIVENREYQKNIISSAIKKNTLVVLPTGIGKTIIGVGVAAHKLHEKPDSKVLVLAPTKPLVVQHKTSFSKALNIPDDNMLVITGQHTPDKRKGIWNEKRLYFATPQVVEHDIVSGKLNLENFSLIVFDEAHRARGDYAYSSIAKKYVDKNSNHLILALTASPGATKEKVGAICGNLFINNIEIRTEGDHDVKEYVHDMDLNWVKVDLPDDFLKIKKFLESALSKRLEFLKKMHFVDSSNLKFVSKKDLLALQNKMHAMLNDEKDPALFQGVSALAAVMKVHHALELLQAQGLEQLNEYFTKLRNEEKKTKAVASLLADEDFLNAERSTAFLLEQHIEHPKLHKLREIINAKISNGKKAIVFTQFVISAEKITKMLANNTIKPALFIGQRKGMTQKNQLQTIEDFRNDKYNVLVATSVGEEGLDIPAVDVVVFYEAVPSEIRSIQRRGRTGRFSTGEVYIIVTKGTMDEAYYWSSIHKERKMKGLLYGMKRGFNSAGIEVSRKSPAQETKGVTIAKVDTKTQASLDNYAKKQDDRPIIYTDHREGRLISALFEKEAEIREMQLKVGDFLLSERCCIERKTSDDFLQSMIDGRLFSQLKNLAEQFDRPLLIIEGNNLFGLRQIHPNAIKGALNSILLDFRIPIIWTKDFNETADILVSLAKREQDENKKPISIKGNIRTETLQDWQQGIIARFPSVDTVLAKRLLSSLGSVKKVVNASELELQSVEGIGKEKAKKIKEIVDAEYKE